LCPLFALAQDLSKNRIEISMNIVVEESNNVETIAFDVDRSRRIVPVVSIVRPAVEFNDKFNGRAEEIRDEGTKGLLSSKFETVQASIAQAVPQLLFRRCGIVAHLPRIGEQLRRDVEAGFLAHIRPSRSPTSTPHPSPLPQGARE
jgi:hypothetical protein